MQAAGSSSNRQRFLQRLVDAVQRPPAVTIPAAVAAAALAVALQLCLATPSAISADLTVPTHDHTPGHIAPDPTASLAGDGKDRLQDLVRNFENRIDNAAAGAGKNLMLSLPAVKPGDAAEQKAARELVAEAVDVVDQVRPC